MRIDRRAVMLGLAGAGLTAALPARAQFNSRDAIRSGGGPSALASEDDEIALGQASMPGRIKGGGGAYPDPRAQEALRRFIRPLVAVCDRPHLPWTAVLTNSREPNANASLGGTLVVCAGLVAMCETQGELASALAHEIGHVDRLHINAKMDLALLMDQAGIGQGGLTQFSGATLPPEIQAKTEGLFKRLLSVSFTRMEEEEADAHIAVIFDRLGLDLRPAASLFTKLAKAGDNFSFETNLTDDHPAPMARAQRIMDQVAFNAPRGREPQLPGWEELKAPFPTPAKFRLRQD